MRYTKYKQQWETGITNVKSVPGTQHNKFCACFQSHLRNNPFKTTSSSLMRKVTENRKEHSSLYARHMKANYYGICTNVVI
jgi:hypothetical protein